jgi:hypothetical protein
MITKISAFLILITSMLFAQPELDIKPNSIEFENLFNRFDYAFLINKGDQILSIDSLSFKDEIYLIDFEDNQQIPFSILPNDSVRMNVTLSGFYNVTVNDTSDTIFVFNNGINSPEPLRVKIDFFEDEFGEFNGFVRDSLTAVDSAFIYFFYQGIYLLDTAVTDASGFYQITLPEGEYTIAAEKDGYYVVFNDSTYDPFFAKIEELDSGEVKSVDFNLKKIDNFNLSVSGTIDDSTGIINIDKGIVIVRKGTHVPAPLGKLNAIILDTINTFAGMVKPDGSYNVYVQSDEYYYFIQAYSNYFLPGYYNDEGSASVFWQNADSLLIDNNIIDKNIVLLRDSSYGAGSIGGDIIFSNPSDQQNFEGITILAKNINNGVLYSYNFGKELGNYKVSNIPFGTYELVAQKIGWENAISQPVIIDPLNNQINGININFTTSNIDEDILPPNNFKLYQNFPNPFNPFTTISFYILNPEQIELRISNILGETIAVLMKDYLASGEYRIQFDASGLPSGIYFYTLKAGNYLKTNKMLLLK